MGMGMDMDMPMNIDGLAPFDPELGMLGRCYNGPIHPGYFHLPYDTWFRCYERDYFFIHQDCANAALRGERNTLAAPLNTCRRALPGPAKPMKKQRSASWNALPVEIQMYIVSLALDDEMQEMISRMEHFPIRPASDCHCPPHPLYEGQERRKYILEPVKNCQIERDGSTRPHVHRERSSSSSSIYACAPQPRSCCERTHAMSLLFGASSTFDLTRFDPLLSAALAMLLTDSARSLTVAWLARVFSRLMAESREFERKTRAVGESIERVGGTLHRGTLQQSAQAREWESSMDKRVCLAKAVKELCVRQRILVEELSECEAEPNDDITQKLVFDEKTVLWNFQAPNRGIFGP